MPPGIYKDKKPRTAFLFRKEKKMGKEGKQTMRGKAERSRGGVEKTKKRH